MADVVVNQLELMVLCKHSFVRSPTILFVRTNVILALMNLILIDCVAYLDQIKFSLHCLLRRFQTEVGWRKKMYPVVARRKLATLVELLI